MSKFIKSLGNRNNMSKFVDMLILSIKNEINLGWELSPIDGFIIGLIYNNSGILREVYSGYGSLTTDNVLQQLEQCTIWISNNEKKLIKSYNSYKG
jgi:hypothetical protein